MSLVGNLFFFFISRQTTLRKILGLKKLGLSVRNYFLAEPLFNLIKIYLTVCVNKISSYLTHLGNTARVLQWDSFFLLKILFSEKSNNFLVNILAGRENNSR